MVFKNAMNKKTKWNLLLSSSSLCWLLCLQSKPSALAIELRKRHCIGSTNTDTGPAQYSTCLVLYITARSNADSSEEEGALLAQTGKMSLLGKVKSMTPATNWRIIFVNSSHSMWWKQRPRSQPPSALWALLTHDEYSYSYEFLI